MSSMAKLDENKLETYAKHLMDVYESGGIEGQPIEIALHAVLKSDVPDDMSVPAALRIKLLFALAIYDVHGRTEKLANSVPGMIAILGKIMGE